MINKDITVGLILGGTSEEREVSKLSASSVLEALNNLKYKIKLIDPAYGLNQPAEEKDFFAEQNYSELSNSNYIAAVNSDLFEAIDTAFIALHGRWGEDGVFQSLLDLKGINYTGSGVLASALSMDKSKTKVMLQHYDVNTPKWFVLKKLEDNYELVIEKVKKFFGFPCVVKPNSQGSAIGLTICYSEGEIKDAVELAEKYSEKILIEEYIDGFELTVGIINNKSLPPLEIKPKHSFYDYECKYTHGMSEYEVPAAFPENVLNHLKQQALLAYNSINCKSYGRVDFRVNKKFESFCLEVNTLPGLTATSLLPKTAKAAGISFDELVDRIVKNSFQ